MPTHAATTESLPTLLLDMDLAIARGDGLGVACAAGQLRLLARERAGALIGPESLRGARDVVRFAGLDAWEELFEDAPSTAAERLELLLWVEEVVLGVDLLDAAAPDVAHGLYTLARILENDPASWAPLAGQAARRWTELQAFAPHSAANGIWEAILRGAAQEPRPFSEA
jgi:hypothetical protein